MIRHHWRLRSVSRRAGEVEPEPEQVFDEPEQEFEPEASDDRVSELGEYAYDINRRVESLEHHVKGLNVVMLVSSAIILWMAVGR